MSSKPQPSQSIFSFGNSANPPPSGVSAFFATPPPPQIVSASTRSTTPPPLFGLPSTLQRESTVGVSTQPQSVGKPASDNGPPLLFSKQGQTSLFPVKEPAHISAIEDPQVTKAKDSIQKLNIIIEDAWKEIVGGIDLANKSNLQSNMLTPAHERLSLSLGAGISECLMTQDDTERLFWLKIAVRAMLAYQTKAIVECWDFDDEEGGKYTNMLYGLIHEKRTQADAGNWRALTRSQLYSDIPYDQTDVPGNLLLQIVEALIVVFVAAGYSMEGAGLHVEKHKTAIERLIQPALNLNTLFGVEVTWCDLSIAWAEPGDVFNVGLVNDAREDAKMRSRRAGGRVLCAVSLGLEQTVGNPTQRKTRLLKPKVYMESVWDELKVKNIPTVERDPAARDKGRTRNN